MASIISPLSHRLVGYLILAEQVQLVNLCIARKTMNIHLK